MMSGTASLATYNGETESDVITIQQFESEMQKKYAEYGAQYKVLDYDESVVLTREILNNSLSEVEDGMNSMEIIEIESTEVSSITSPMDIQPLVMPVAKTVHKSWALGGYYGSAGMRSTVISRKMHRMVI